MKTYTMSWKMYGKFGIKGYSVCRQVIWPFPHCRPLPLKTPIEFFLCLIEENNYNFGSAHKDFRLTCRGRLVARLATYQGV